MDNDINQSMEQQQQMGQQANQQQGQAIPPQQMPQQPVNPVAPPYPPCPHHNFWGKQINMPLWKGLLAGALILILAFGFGMFCGRASGFGRMRRMAPFMMQMPNNGQRGFFHNNGGSSDNGTYQAPNGGERNPKGYYQNPGNGSKNSKGSFQIPDSAWGK